MTTAITLFARKTVSEYRIPFEISGKVPNAETLAAMEEVPSIKFHKGFNLSAARSFVFLIYPQTLLSARSDHHYTSLS